MKIEEVLKNFDPPFEARNQYVMDSKGHMIAQARGYGYMCKCLGEDVEGAMDIVAKFIAESLNMKVKECQE